MMKKLREMFPNGMYTDNSEAVFKRFQELLSNDENEGGDCYYGDELKYCGVDGNWHLELMQSDYKDSYGSKAIYLTNEQFFAITLDEETKSKDKPKPDNHQKPKVSTLKSLYDNQKAADEWLNKIPSEVSDTFFDTPYIDGIQKNNNILMEEVFGIYTDAVEWLLYEFSPNKNLSCGIDGKMFDINTPEEYYQYLIDYEGWVE